MNPLTKNHFELFGLPERFSLDPAELDRAYRAVQSAVHPDRFAAAGDTDRRIAMQLATQVNEAYRTLRNPTGRAAYLCELNGADPQIHSNTAMPAGFLVQQMEWRERLDDASASRRRDELGRLREELEAARHDLLRELASSLDDAGDFPAAAGWVRQLMFIDRFAVEVDDTEERLLQA
ncbi:MAG: hypothetical protein RIS35_527 [Pseudomonadota bacterium]|jgi:molecular chaperone HscB